MTPTLRLVARLWLFATALAVASTASAQPYDPALYQEMRWRSIGPFRGGRTKAAEGVRSQPNVFYIGVVNGGVWKTTDYGRTWVPIFDDQPTGSIGAIAVAPSNPDVVYVGSGEGMQRPDLSTGDGVYKSTDAGRTWQHLGLRDGQQIPQIVVDPRNPNRLFVAVLGHPYGPNEERGIFRSTDGGATFEKVLYKDADTGGVDVAFDPANADVVYAVLWESRQGPWENGVFSGPGSGLFKSIDGGTTWRQLTRGLPTYADGLGRIGITVAPSEPKRLFATVEATKGGGLYRSDDAGESWTRVNSDPRVLARPSDAAEVRVHPANPDVVFVPTIVTWKSTDGGKTFTGIRGAPGGDDYQRLWINPDRPDIMILSSDQGAVITVNGGDTWSSWYNQPTAQFYHVSTDNAFPYRVCGGQQESGSACVASRGDDGQITFREWHPVGVEEYGYVASDPLDPDIVYGGKVSRYDRRTGQVQNVAPRALRGGDYRVIRTQPVLFSPVDKKTLYVTSNVVWKTTDGGSSWQSISPDLTRKTWAVPKNVGKYAATDAARPDQRGVVYALAPSPIDANTLWAGTDDGLVHVTRDGGASWRDVTPPDLVAWAKVSLIEASHFDVEAAYAAVNTFRLDDLRPHVYRTRDGGKTWTRIVQGIPDGAVVNAVRQDPQRKDLLYAGTELQVFVSFDDGDHWQSLRLNMPATSIRDLVVKDDDLVVGTHGRGFWILDDVTPLRQLTREVAAAGVHLFKPQQAWRFRWNKNTDTPLPPDEPAGQNPPDGAIINYWLRQPAQGVVTLEIFDAAQRLVRRYASDDPPEAPVEGRNIPDYWIRPPQKLAASAGMHRFVWDVRHPPPAVQSFSYPIAAVRANTPRVPQGPFVLPGEYTARLRVGGQSYTQTFAVRMDPRVKATSDDLARQSALSMQLYEALAKNAEALSGARRLVARLAERQQSAGAGALGTTMAAVEQKARALEGHPARFGEGGQPGLAPIGSQLAQLLELVDEVDARPTTQAEAAIGDTLRASDAVLEAWRAFQAGEVAALDDRLRAAGLEPIR